MTIVEITGGMLRAARSLTGLSQQELADRASISRPLPDGLGRVERERAQRQYTRPAPRCLGALDRRHRVSSERRPSAAPGTDRHSQRGGSSMSFGRQMIAT